MANAQPRPNPEFASALHYVVHIVFVLLHAAILAYVAGGWLISDHEALFVYTLVLPLIALQWLLNRGASIVSNFEVLVRTGHWSDQSLALEATLFRRALSRFGVKATNAEINLVVLSTMFFFWMAAMYRMVLVAPALLPH